MYILYTVRLMFLKGGGAVGLVIKVRLMFGSKMDPRWKADWTEEAKSFLKEAVQLQWSSSPPRIHLRFLLFFFDANTNTSCPHVRDSRIHKHPHHTCQLSGGGDKGGGGHRVLHVPVLLAGCSSAGNKGDCFCCLCAQLCQVFFFFFLALPSLRSDECLAPGTWHQVPQWAWTSGNRNSNSRM